MTESEYKENDSELIRVYYDIYMYSLVMDIMSIEECEAFLVFLEEQESYLECAGVFKAIERYKDIKIYDLLNG